METYDIVIIGAGPAGITSAIYASRAGLNYCLIEKGPIGGKVINAYEIENYPGFSKIEGPMLALNFRKQIKDLNINLKKEEVTLIDKMDDTFYINTSKEKYQAKYVIIATGTKENELKLPNEEALKGRGISFCATCDGAFFKDKDVVVYGGGDSAITEAAFLAQIVKHLTIVSRHELRGETNNIKKLQAYNNVSYIPNTIITEVIGKDYLEAVKLLSSDNKETILKTNGLFVYIGSKPELKFLNYMDILNSKGYIEVDNHFETKVPNLFAIGDVIEKELRQIVTAESDGANVIHAIQKKMR